MAVIMTPDLDLLAMWSTDSISNPSFVEYISEENYRCMNVPPNINESAPFFFHKGICPMTVMQSYCPLLYSNHTG